MNDCIFSYVSSYIISADTNLYQGLLQVFIAVYQDGTYACTCVICYTDMLLNQSWQKALILHVFHVG